MAKSNRQGRSKSEQFIRLHKGVTGSEAYQSLSCVARSLLIEIWRRHNGINNGAIGYSVRMAAKALHVSQQTAGRAFQELQGHGFIILRYRGSFNNKVGAGGHRASEWELTTEPTQNGKPKANYKNWQKENTLPSEKPNASAAKAAHKSEESDNPGTLPSENPIPEKSDPERSHQESTSSYHRVGVSGERDVLNLTPGNNRENMVWPPSTRPAIH